MWGKHLWAARDWVQTFLALSEFVIPRLNEREGGKYDDEDEDWAKHQI